LSSRALPSQSSPCRSSSFESRWRTRIRSARHPRARAQDRASASRARPVRAPRQARQPQQPRQPLGVTPIGLDPLRRGPRDLARAATRHSIFARAHARASSNPVGPASYATRTGAGNRDNHVTDGPLAAGRRSNRSSPLRPSSTPATTDRACRSTPTQLPSPMTRASRNCGSTAAPLATAARANLRARRRALHTV
jgi:hypothetical protein